MKTSKVPKSYCWRCHQKLDGATNVAGNRMPRQGDLSVCKYCYAIAIYRPDLTLRKLTEIESQQLLENKDLSRKLYEITNYLRELNQTN